MNNLIFIESENLLNQVLFKLDKLDNGFTKEELNKITDLVINCEEETNINKTLKELLLFSALEDLTIRNSDLSDDFLNELLDFKNLKSLTFEKCYFEDLNILSKLNVTSLSFKTCSIKDYSFIPNNIKELSITNDIVKMSVLNKLNNLEYLELSYSNIDMDESFNLNKLNTLLIDNTNINDFDFINKLNDLKSISIDRNQYKENQELFKNLQSKGIKVYNESIVEFSGESYE